MHMTTHSPYHKRKALHSMGIRSRPLELTFLLPDNVCKKKVRPDCDLYQPFTPDSLHSQHYHHVDQRPQALNIIRDAFEAIMVANFCSKTTMVKYDDVKTQSPDPKTPPFADLSLSVFRFIIQLPGNMAALHGEQRANFRTTRLFATTGFSFEPL